MSRITAFPLIMLLFLLSSILFSVQGCPPHELKALLRFKSTINDTAGMLESWKGADCCEWDGVQCYGIQEGRHVAKLDLQSFWLESLRGEIDSSLFELNHLNYLDLSSNYFHGEIPSGLGKLSSLSHLDISCYFCDTPLTSSNLQWLSNMSSLEFVSLSGLVVGDKIWGSKIGSLLRLKHLVLSRCSLPEPTIPTALLNLSSLTSLDLSGNSFSDMPTWIGKLSSLTHLDLAANNISGSISDTIGNLTGLEYLDLSSNALIGQIPPYLGLNRRQYGGLSYLDLGGNNLEGTIPASLGNLHELRVLYLDHNHLSGSLPISFAHQSSLFYLDVSGNHLNGSIPSTLMLPSSLKVLDLSDNNMNGTITEFFFQKSLKLEVLDLSHSGLSINISSTWIPSFQLNALLLKKCGIGGRIPSWISTQYSLVTLDLSATQLSGNLPSWLWDIDEVHLSDNHLQGSFTPTSGALRYLDLSMNELGGRLPADIHVNLSKAEVLILTDNKFEGQIPTSIAKLTNLTFLDMSINCLTGNIPAALGDLTRLQAVNLESNYLEGEIPKELGRLSFLKSLRIGKNSLQGVLPSSLRNLSELEVLDVAASSLTGNIPNWIANFSNLYVLVMRSNNFGGNLPPEIGRMPNLQVLDLSSNLFTGAIPHSYFRLPAMLNGSAEGRQLVISSESFSYGESIDLIVKGQERHYEYVLSSLACIDLSNNRLSGSLAPEIDNLRGLMYLNLSMNCLRGPIPESLGNLVQLESVDLSSNNFSGHIPWQLGNLTFLAHLNLSYNHLCGKIPLQGGQMLTFDESSYIGNANLWGCPLKRKCSRPVAGVSPPAIGVEKRREEGFEVPWYEMCFGLSVGVGFSAVVVVLVVKLSWRTKCFEVMDRGIEKMDRVIWALPRSKLKPKAKSMCGVEGISCSCLELA